MAALVAELRASRKYGGVDAEALTRTSAWALDRSRSRKEASKVARRKLHQVFGSYLPAAGLADAEAAARELGHGGLEDVCRGVLAAHASTRERLEVMPDFFATAFGPRAGAVRVADIGAGLNAFAIPWMPLASDAEYVAIDVDERMQRLVEQLAAHVPVRLAARTEDIVSAAAPIAADVVLLLKVVAPLELQSPGSVARLLERIEAPRIVITLSARSIGGRKRLVNDHYEAMLDPVIAQLAPRSISRYEFPSETMLVVDDTPPSRRQHGPHERTDGDDREPAAGR